MRSSIDYLEDEDQRERIEKILFRLEQQALMSQE